MTEFIIQHPSGVGGWYELQAKDACGNFKTIKVYVPDLAPAPSVSSGFNNFANCDGDAQYTVSGSGEQVLINLKFCLVRLIRLELLIIILQAKRIFLQRMELILLEFRMNVAVTKTLQ